MAEETTVVKIAGMDITSKDCMAIEPAKYEINMTVFPYITSEVRDQQERSMLPEMNQRRWTVKTGDHRYVLVMIFSIASNIATELKRTPVEVWDITTGVLKVNKGLKL